jgi:hypothetical protein
MKADDKSAGIFLGFFFEPEDGGDMFYLKVG